MADGSPGELAQGPLWVGAIALFGGLTLALSVWTRRRRSPDRVGPLDLGLAFAGLFWGSALGTLISLRLSSGGWDLSVEPPQTVMLAGSAIGALVGAGIGLLRARPDALGLRAASPGWLGRALLVLPAFLVASQLWVLLLELFGLGVDEQELVGLMRSLQGTPAGTLALLYAVVGAPLAEELLFRGLGVAALLPRLGRAGTVVATALLFGLMHGADPQAVVPLFGLGLGLAWLRLGSGSLLPPLLLHAANNAVVVLLLSLDAS